MPRTYRIEAFKAADNGETDCVREYKNGSLYARHFYNYGVRAFTTYQKGL